MRDTAFTGTPPDRAHERESRDGDGALSIPTQPFGIDGATIRPRWLDVQSDDVAMIRNTLPLNIALVSFLVVLTALFFAAFLFGLQFTVQDVVKFKGIALLFCSLAVLFLIYHIAVTWGYQRNMVFDRGTGIIRGRGQEHDGPKPPDKMPFDSVVAVQLCSGQATGKGGDQPAQLILVLRIEDGMSRVLLMNHADVEDLVQEAVGLSTFLDVRLLDPHNLLEQYEASDSAD